MRRLPRSVAFWVVAALVLLVAASGLWRQGEKPVSLRLDQFTSELEAGRVDTARIIDGRNAIEGKLSSGKTYVVRYPGELADELTQDLLEADRQERVQVSAEPVEPNIWLALLVNWGPLILIGAIILFFLNSLQGGGNRVMQFGKAKPKVVSKDQPKVTFADVAGADEAVAELHEIKEFLESPAKFQAMGARIPKGVLLFGPPGTGKTLLARAVAGEAGVPFFSISGSDFVEMFVGVGASRVRDLFEQAKQSAPAIIFVDEIDAVGRQRGAGLGGGHDEREQTLNQLLVEMDGFDVRTGVILIAATNRPDILDPALLRPGRFDRQIVVDQPDLEGRKAILSVHAKDKPLASGVDLAVLARRTPGFTGADLANLLNEAALLAARSDRKEIGMFELEEAIDRVIAGPERKTRVMSEKEKRITAYHEAGHALVGHVLPNADPVHKVSIVARGRALGWTLSLPVEDRYTHTRSELRDRIAVLMGGRTAEEIAFNEITTGAANDIEKATEIARAMVTEYGMSERLGPQQLGQRGHEVFLGREMGHQATYSDEVAGRIDQEVGALIEAAQREARAILTAHRAVLDRLADALIERETLDTAEIMEIFADLPVWTGAEAAEAAATASRSPRSGSRQPARRRTTGSRTSGSTGADGSGPSSDAEAGKGRRRAPVAASTEAPRRRSRTAPRPAGA